MDIEEGGEEEEPENDDELPDEMVENPSPATVKASLLNRWTLLVLHDLATMMMDKMTPRLGFTDPEARAARSQKLTSIILRNPLHFKTLNPKPSDRRFQGSGASSSSDPIVTPPPRDRGCNYVARVEHVIGGVVSDILCACISCIMHAMLSAQDTCR